MFYLPIIFYIVIIIPISQVIFLEEHKKMNIMLLEIEIIFLPAC